MNDEAAIFIAGIASGITLMTVMFLIDGIVQDYRAARRWQEQRYPLDDRRRWQ